MDKYRLLKMITIDIPKIVIKEKWLMLISSERTIKRPFGNTLSKDECLRQIVNHSRKHSNHKDIVIDKYISSGIK